MKARALVLALLLTTPAAAQSGAPAPDDCGCEGDKQCLFFCGVKQPGDPGAIGSHIGNKGEGYQQRVLRQDLKKPDAK